MNEGIIKKIGSGSFSTVYLCNNNNNFYILKEIRLNDLLKKKISKTKRGWATRIAGMTVTPFTYTKPKTLIECDLDDYYKKLDELILSEIEVLKSTRHKNIVEMFSSSKTDDIYNIKMEYCYYGDLHYILKKSELFQRNKWGGLDGDIFIQLVKDTVEGLEYLHDYNFIHRDIKPHNILVDLNEGKCIFKLSDLGFICNDITESKTSFMELDDKIERILLTKYYKTCGTPYYMAPEIICYNGNSIEKHFYNKSVDIWSLGVSIYESYFNKLPIVAKDIGDIINFYTKNDFNKYFRTNLNKYIFLSDSIIELFVHTITTNANMRYNIKKLKNLSTRLDLSKKELSELDEIIDAYESVNLEDLEQSYLKKHILHKNILETIQNKSIKMSKSESWIELDSSSIGQNIRIPNNFMKWFRS